MVVARVSEAPLGPKNLWPLLTLRGVSGVLGSMYELSSTTRECIANQPSVWGFYYSLRFLPISEAIVINFLAPMVAAFASGLISGKPATIAQQIAGAISILGVVLVSQPWHLPAETARDVPADIGSDSTICKNCSFNVFVAPPNHPFHQFTSLERITAILAGLAGVIGAATAYVAMSLIGKNAHPVVTVSHFAAWAVLLTSLGVAVTGVEAFRMPSPLEWGMLLFLGTFALLLHVLVAASLSCEGSNRALYTIYTQIVFALVMDEVLWGLRPNSISLVGGTLILGSVVTVAVAKEQTQDKTTDKHELENEACDAEEIEMMIGKDDVRPAD